LRANNPAEKATSELLPAGSEDIALNLEICDQIRSKAAPAKDAMRYIKNRLNHKNPNVQLLTLGLTDTCVKNGGDHFLTEVASREFMDNLTSILKMPALNLEVKNTILRLIQNWSVAFEGKPALSYVGQVYKTLLNEGAQFPSLLRNVLVRRLTHASHQTRRLQVSAQGPDSSQLGYGRYADRARVD
jgi:hepatocyte growth factor-regulated tyrosine kinase substrate